MVDDMAVLDLSGNVVLYRRGSYIEIVRRWRGIRTLLSGGITVAWILYQFFGIPSGEPVSVSPADPGFLFSAAVALLLGYATLVFWINRTHITIGTGKITIAHRPLPWPGGSEYPLSDVQQLQAVKRTRSRGGDSYQLELLRRGAGWVMLLSDLRSLEEAETIERAIEKYLRIRDDPQSHKALPPDAT